MSDELSSALRELATAHETPPVVGGAETRGRALRRRRRRRTAVALGAGATALALVGLALTLDLDGHPDRQGGARIPAAEVPTSVPAQSVPPSPSAAVPVSGTLRLPDRRLTFGGRVLPVLSAFESKVGYTGLLTVVARHESKDLAVDLPSKGPVKVSVPYVVELRDTKDQPLYIGTYTKPLALGDLVATSDWIGLGAEDAKRLYAGIRIGDAISLTTTTTPTDQFTSKK
ncbi:hypothetical protein ACFY1L_41340 [Streptomyces sp. NPDC001663]|uniref:hypothetical protein n=1 Tax=Streptomyces sp. NPDC001663 TaxID=3364597 RepID=UPI0036CC8EC9